MSSVSVRYKMYIRNKAGNIPHSTLILLVNVCVLHLNSVHSQYVQKSISSSVFIVTITLTYYLTQFKNFTIQKFMHKSFKLRLFNSMSK